MTESIELDMNDLHGMTSTDLMKAAAQDGVIFSGTYITKVSKVFARRNAEDADYNADRVMVTLAATFYQEDGKTPVGNTYIKTSPEARLTRTGRLDEAAKRYVELVKIVGVKDGDVGAVVTKATQVAFNAKVQEQYVVSEEDLHPSHSDARIGTDGQAWIVLKPEDTAEREHYIGLGLEPRVKVSKLFPLK